MQGAGRDAPILHERRCDRRLMREDVARRGRWTYLGRPSVVRVDVDSVAWRRISIERESFFCRWCRVAWTTLTAAATQPTVPASGGFSLVP